MQAQFKVGPITFPVGQNKLSGVDAAAKKVESLFGKKVKKQVALQNLGKVCSDIINRKPVQIAQMQEVISKLGKKEMQALSSQMPETNLFKNAEVLLGNMIASSAEPHVILNNFVIQNITSSNFKRHFNTAILKNFQKAVESRDFRIAQDIIKSMLNEIGDLKKENPKALSVIKSGLEALLDTIQQNIGDQLKTMSQELIVGTISKDTINYLKQSPITEKIADLLDEYLDLNKQGIWTSEGQQTNAMDIAEQLFVEIDQVQRSFKTKLPTETLQVLGLLGENLKVPVKIKYFLENGTIPEEPKGRTYLFQTAKDLHTILTALNNPELVDKTPVQTVSALVNTAMGLAENTPQISHHILNFLNTQENASQILRGIPLETQLQFFQNIAPQFLEFASATALIPNITQPEIQQTLCCQLVNKFCNTGRIQDHDAVCDFLYDLKTDFDGLADALATNCSQNNCIDVLIGLRIREIDQHKEQHNLLRQDNLGSKLENRIFKPLFNNFMDKFVRPFVKNLQSTGKLEKLALGQPPILKPSEELLNIAQQFLNQFIKELPEELKVQQQFIATILKNCSKNEDLLVRNSACSNSIFLRFLNPSFIKPMENGLLGKEPTEKESRALIFFSKIIQYIANVNSDITSNQDQYIIPFVKKNTQNILNFYNKFHPII